MEGLSSILAPVDFTTCSAAALKEALRLAKAADARLRVVHVLDTLLVADLEEQASKQGHLVRDSLRQQAREQWRSFSAGIPGAADFPIDVVIGHLVPALVEMARAGRDDLMVLGAFGARRPDAGLGTVASACTRYASPDVLIVRDAHEGAWRRIVACVDFSPTSLCALERAARLARNDEAELFVLHLHEPPGWKLHWRALAEGADPASQRERSENLAAMLRKVCEPALAEVPEKLRHFELFEWSGHRSGIAAYAGKVGADLVVLGTRGRANLRDALLGSTAERVLRDAESSILAVRPPKEG
jgi:nucleotide-binding universal stress UspA family protein